MVRKNNDEAIKYDELSEILYLWLQEIAKSLGYARATQKSCAWLSPINIDVRILGCHLRLFMMSWKCWCYCKCIMLLCAVFVKYFCLLMIQWI